MRLQSRHGITVQGPAIPVFPLPSFHNPFPPTNFLCVFLIWLSSERMTPYPLHSGVKKKPLRLSVQPFLRVQCSSHTPFLYVHLLSVSFLYEPILGGPRLFFPSMFLSVSSPPSSAVLTFLFPFVSVAYICAAHILIIAL